MVLSLSLCEQEGVNMQRCASSVLAVVFLVACGGPTAEETSSESVVGGSLQNHTNPEIGRFITPFSGSCTATLIAPDIAITAAHCVRYESSGSGGGQVRFRSAQGNVDAYVSAYRSFSTQPGRADVALLKLSRDVASRIATPRPLAARAPQRGETVQLWGYGCTQRDTRNSQGKTTITSRYGSSQNLCKGDSGGPLINTSGQIIGINSAYDTISGADIFALPSSLRSAIQSQVEAFGFSGSVYGTRPGNTQGPETGTLGSAARVWRQTAGLRACGQWSKAENFSSGRYNAHRYRLTISPGGPVSLSLSRSAGSWAPAFVIATADGGVLGQGRDARSGVTLRAQHDGRDGNPARLTLSAERTISLDVYVTGWRAVQSNFQNGLTRTARYQLAMGQQCGGSPAEPPPSTAIRNLPFRTRGDTRQGRNLNSRYSCAPNTNEGGPELFYTIDVPVAGVIAARLSNLGAGVDVDVHIVVGDTCVSRGHWVASARVPAGRHRVIVDTWVDSSGRARSGAFDLEVGYTQPAQLVEAGLSAPAADRALTAFSQAFTQGATEELVLTVVDLDLGSERPRLVGWDLLAQKALVQAHVGHGSGGTLAADPTRVVSVGEDRERSPVGLLLAGQRAEGPDGPRLQLDGIEPGFNDQARARALAIAVDPGAGPERVEAEGAPALTDGSFGVSEATMRRLLEVMGDGALVLVHFSDPSWLEASDYLD